VSKNIKNNLDEVMISSNNLLNNHPLIPFMETQNDTIIKIYNKLMNMTNNKDIEIKEDTKIQDLLFDIYELLYER
jgi:hypothetical protein